MDDLAARAHHQRRAERVQTPPGADALQEADESRAAARILDTGNAATLIRTGWAGDRRYLESGRVAALMVMPPRPQETPAVNVRVTSHALDVLFKLEAEHLAHLLPTRFGLNLAPIRRHLPTEMPQLALHLERLDHVFELEDGTILHLEFEAAVSVDDLIRFLRYALVLLVAYPGRRVRTVVFCGPRTRQAPLPIDGGTLPYRLDGVLIGDQDGEAVLARLHARVAAGQPWSEADRLDLVLLPLMRHGRDTEAVVREGLELAEALPTAEQPRAMAALLALAYHYVGEAALNRLMEGLMATNLLAQVLAESMEQGLEQGLEQGRIAGLRQAARTALEGRFGTLDVALLDRLAGADESTLLELLAHIADELPLVRARLGLV